MIFYKDITSEEMPFKLVPSLFPSQLIISSTSQEYISRQQTNSLDPPPVGFEPQIQLTVLQNKLQPETESRNSLPSETDETHDITLREQQISNVET